MSTLQLIHLIEQDLRALSNEARRRFADVKDAAERAMVALRSVQAKLPPSASPAEQGAAVAASQDVLMPFMLALASKSDTLPQMALGAVQRMISHAALAPHQMPAVISQLIARAQSPYEDEKALLKVLQTVLTIASSPALLHADATVSQLLVLCLSLQNARAPTIRNTASATMQQFVSLLLDAVEREPGEAIAGGEAIATTPGGSAERLPKPKLDELTVAARCAFLAVQDLCLLAGGEPAQWLPPASATGPTSVPFALEVVQRCLASHGRLFRGRAPFVFLLRERVAALVLKTVQQPQPEWAVALRLAHLTCTMLASYAPTLLTESEVLLTALTKLLEADGVPIWQRALVLEALRVMLQEPPLLRAFFLSYDADRPTTARRPFCTLVGHAVHAVLRSKEADLHSHAEYIEPIYLRHARASGQAAAMGKRPTFNLALYSEADGSGVTNDYMAALAIECQLRLAHAIASLADAADDAAADAEGGAASPPKAPADDRAARGMAKALGQPLLGSLSLLLARCGTEETAQATLKAYQALTQACGALGLGAPLEAFLASLCKHALPAQKGHASALDAASSRISFAPVDEAYSPLPHTTLSAKHVQALKALFNVAHCMGALLGASWAIILQALEQLDRIIAASKTTPAASTPSRDLSVATGGAEATTAELHVLSSALDNLFKGSTRLDDAAISHFLTALSSQCLSALAHEATSREKAAVPGGAAPARLFALNKFVETAMANLERIATLWPLVTQLLLPVANHKAVRVRVLGAEALAKLVVAAMRHQLAAAPPASADAPRTPPPGPPAPPPSAAPPLPGADLLLLAPLEELQRRCAHRETQERILQAAHQILQACGARLHRSWPLLLSLLYRAATRPALAPLLPLAFRSVELISSDFLAVLPPRCLLAYAEVAAVNATQQTHVNVALTAVGLQWSIGDFLVQKAKASGGADADADDGGGLVEDASALDRDVVSAPDVGEEDDAGGVVAGSPQLEAEGGGTALASAPRYCAQFCAILRNSAQFCAILRNSPQLF